MIRDLGQCFDLSGNRTVIILSSCRKRGLMELHCARNRGEKRGANDSLKPHFINIPRKNTASVYIAELYESDERFERASIGTIMRGMTTLISADGNARPAQQ